MRNANEPGSPRRSSRVASGFIWLKAFVPTPMRSVETLFEMYQPAKSKVSLVDGLSNSTVGSPLDGFQ